MGWGAAAGGAASGGLSGVAGYFGQRDANKAAAAEAQKQRDWQERMASSAHQREVEDLRKAGLNPILSATGSGSGTPSGAMPMVRSTMEAAASAAASTPRVMADLNKILADTKMVKASTEIAEAAAFSAKNKQTAEEKHPEFYGNLDAVLQRLGIASRAALGIGGGVGAAGVGIRGGRKAAGTFYPKIRRKGD